MRLKPLVLAIANLHQSHHDSSLEVGEIKSLYKPKGGLTVVRPEFVPARHAVEIVRIEGEDFVLSPGLTIVDGIARRVIETPDYIHVFSVKANFATGDVVGHLQSFEYGSHEYVYMKGEWAITTYATNLNRRTHHV